MFLNADQLPGQRSAVSDVLDALSARPSTKAEPVAARRKAGPGGLLGPACLLVAMGVLVQAWISYRGRTSGSFPAPMYFLSLCAIYTPAVGVAASKWFSARVKVWFTTYSAVAQLICRFLMYPSQFVYHDEIIHQQVVQSIDRTGHLFGANSILPVIPYYPGTEITTSAVQQLTNLQVHPAGMLVLLVARVIMILALIRIVQFVSRSATVACLAAVIYAANPQFVSFLSFFSYQSMALPLAFFAVYVFARREPARGPVGLIAAAAAFLAVAVTHHLTALALLVVFWVWLVFATLSRKPVSQLLSMCLIATAIIGAWTWVARSQVVPYIGQIVTGDSSTLLSLVEGRSSHHFFTNSANSHAARWEVALSLGAVLIIGIALLPALWHGVRRFKDLPTMALVLLLVAAAYPIWPLGHLTGPTSEAADRASAFIFVGIGYAGAAWFYNVVYSGQRHRRRINARWAITALSAGLSICLAGDTIIGAGQNWGYGPGPYMVEADNRSIDYIAMTAGYWETANLRSGSRILADRDNALIALTYGTLKVLTEAGTKTLEGPASTLLLSSSSAGDVSVVCADRVQYLVADRRLAGGLPNYGIYTDSGEYLEGTRTTPPPASALTKFDNVPGAERIYDNGSIRIYDLKEVSCAGKK